MTFVTENRIWEQAECLPRGALSNLQMQRLRQVLAQVAQVPFYQEALAKAGVTSESLQSLADLRRLPFTTKEDLRQHYPLGFCAVPREQIARIHGSSGTTGKPTFVAYTREDLVLVVGLLTALNQQIAAIKITLIIIAILAACIAIRIYII